MYSEKVKGKLEKYSTPIPGAGCVLWTASTKRDGYGHIRADGKIKAAHRVAMEIAIGRTLLPDELVCHKCDTPSCINPNHLFIGSSSDNALDRERKARGRKSNGVRKGRDVRLSDEAVARIRRDRRLAREVAVEYGVSIATILRVRSRENWAHVAEEDASESARRKHTPWSDSDLMAIVEARRAGKTTVQLAKEYGVWHQAISSIHQKALARIAAGTLDAGA